MLLLNFCSIADTLRPHQRRPFTCNATSQTDSHPASYMVDGLNSTHWQSKASLDVANITIDLTSSRQRVFPFSNLCCIVLCT